MFVVSFVVSIVLLVVLKSVTDSDSALLIGVCCGLGSAAGFVASRIGPEGG